MILFGFFLILDYAYNLIQNHRMKMSDQNEQPNFNSHPEKDLQLQQHGNHQNQCYQSEVPSSSEGATKEPKMLTNIYYDCLERIFDFLDIESLLNVAQTCKRLQIAAIAKFGDDYGDELITGFTHFGHEIQTRGDDQRTVFKIYGLKHALPYLRCFGAKLSKLLVLNRDEGVINNDAAKEARLYEYLNRYCANSLTRLDYCGNGTFFEQNFPMQFVKVEPVRICGYNEKNPPNIADFFPKAQDLSIKRHSDDSMSIIRNDQSFGFIPNLKNLTLENFTIESAAKLLHANRRLRSLDLTLSKRIKFDRLVDMLDGNLSISELEIDGMLTDMNEVNLNRFIVQCPKIKVLSLLDCSFASDLAFILIDELRSLKRFEFVMNDRSEFDHLVSRMEKVKKAWKHSFEFDNHEITYLSEREQE